MLTGTELGKAIAEAIRMKGISKAAVARHFGVKPPSVTDWCNRGSIGKDKLDELFLFFSDVVGPAHWGRSAKAAKNWPESIAVKEPERKHSRPLVQKVCDIAEKIDDTGLRTLIDMAECIARNHALVKTKRA